MQQYMQNLVVFLYYSSCSTVLFISKGIIERTEV